MNKILTTIAAVGLIVTLPSCIEEFDPQGGSVTANQAANAPGAYDNFVNAITANISGKFVFPSSRQANDFGYTSMYLRRDVMGNDMVAIGNNWFSTWYQCGVGLAPIYLNCQYPWTFYYVGIKSCNTVLSLAGEEPDATKIHGAGIAHTIRALYYLELAQQFAPKTYAADKQSPTVPIITDAIDLSSATENPRATNEEMFKFILADLDVAETQLADYNAPDKFTPNINFVYGLKARTYLLMEDWANAEKYAKLAQQGYSVMTAAQYTDRNHGFNDATFTNAWIMGCTFKPDDPTITNNDGDNCWGTWMQCEYPVGSTGLGYYNIYGGANYMDRHLYETIPATDCRKKCFGDFALDEMESKEEIVEALKAYSDVPEYVYYTGQAQLQYGGMPFKFRNKDGNHTMNQEGYCVDVPMMRVEEMILIEAEAAGMQNEARGIEILTNFAKTRDPEYVYGTHNEAYNNPSTSAFRNEIWWQRRVELWGEGFSTLDVKRLQKGIIRSYPGSNHVDGYRWNTNEPPQWMTFCIVQTESNYNTALVNNPTPVAPVGNSPEHTW